jgi:hypothetical protein
MFRFIKSIGLRIVSIWLRIVSLYKNRYYVINNSVYIHHRNLILLLRECCNDPVLYNSDYTITIPLKSCQTYLPQIKSRCNETGSLILADFIKLIEHKSKNSIVACNTMVQDGRISFDNLVHYFSIGKEVCYMLSNTSIAGKIDSTLYTYDGDKIKFAINIQIIRQINDSTYYELVCKKISHFNNLTQLDTLPVKYLDNKMHNVLHERGMRCLAYYNQEYNYVRHEGFTLSCPYPYNKHKTQYSKGRIVIDHQYFYETCSEYYGPNLSFNKKKCDIKETEYHLIYPYMSGYDISCHKSWHEFYIDNIQQIEFNKDIFDMLSIPESHKDMILACIRNKQYHLSDLILNKGSGLIFLLQGSTGVGKTLTAETTAEYLKRPLYYVNVGDLGTEPVKMEQNLNDILRLAERWNAILLLDEADIFLEARDNFNITRNAMVGIFLRSLEYYSGVIFLTSNRSNNIDSAVKSRVHMTLKYELNATQRIEIWTNLLKQIPPAGDIKNIDVKTLSNADLNGRQIRNIINLTQSYSKCFNKSITTGLIMIIAKNTISDGVFF